MTGNRIWAVAIVAFALAWVLAGIVTSKAIATLAGDLDVEVRLAGRDLALPIAAGRPVANRESYALEIPAARGTAVVATDNGRVLRLAATPGRGVTLYQTDTGNDVIYAYAHLERIADGLREGSTIKRGDVIGYVGAHDKSVLGPRLHFEILRLPRDKQWANATAIDPAPFFMKAKASPTLAISSH